MGKYEQYYENIKELNKLGKTNSEISRILGIDSRRITDINIKLGLMRKNTYDYIKLNELEKQVVLGNVIGDGCIFKDKRSLNYRMNLAHSLKQKEYFLKKYELIKRLVSGKPKERKWIDVRTGKEYSEIRYQTFSNELFNELHSIWYKDNKKIIPKENIKDITNIVLAIKYFDDGYYNKKSCYIAMDNFSDESISNFRQAMKENFNIETKIHCKNKIYIPVSQFPKFVDIVKPFATSDVLYKLGEFGGTLNK